MTGETTPQHPEQDDKSSDDGMTYGLIVGMMLGTTVFVLFDNVLFIALGPVMGLVAGMLWSSAKGGDGDDDLD